MRARTTIVTIISVLLLALPSVAQGERHPYTIAHVLRFASGEDIVGLNPHFNQQGVVGYLSHMTMAYLVRYDAHNRPVPELAMTIPTQANGGISRDGKTITYHLRQDAKWSDGVAFTSADVAFSVAVVQNPKNDEAGGDDFHRILRVDTPDPYTAVLHLKAPFSDFLATYFGTGGANPCLLPKHLLGDLPELNDAAYNSLPVGIGPFKYASWKRGESVELVPDPLYFRGRPKLERVIFKIIPDRNTMLTQLTTHEIDLWIPAASSYVPRLRAIPGITVAILPSYFYNHVDFNGSHGALRDPIVRRALRMGTDRATILAKISHGIGSLQEGLLAPTHPFYDPHIALVPYYVAGANRLLDRAGYVRGPDGIRAKNGQRLAFSYGTSLGTPDTDAMIELIRASWKQLGVDLTVRRYLAASFFGPYSAGGILYAGKFDVANFAWGVGPLGDQENIFSCRRIPPSGQNVTRYCNAEVDRAMVDFNTTYDEARQRRDAWTIQERIVRDAPTIVMSARADVIAYNTDLRNFRPNQVSPFDDMLNVDI